MDTKKRATRAERQVAQSLGGRRVPFSGSGAEKGDVTVPHKVTQSNGTIEETTLFSFRVEVKSTRGGAFALRVQDWVDIVASAGKAGQVPLMVIQLRPQPHRVERLVLMYSKFYGGLTEIKPVKWEWEPSRSMLIHGTFPHARQVLLDCERGDLVLCEYNDFLALVRKAEREAKA